MISNVLLKLMVRPCRNRKQSRHKEEKRNLLIWWHEAVSSMQNSGGRGTRVHRGSDSTPCVRERRLRTGDFRVTDFKIYLHLIVSGE